MKDERIDFTGQHVPNCAGILESDGYTGTGHRYEFYPEDIKIMFQMDDKEMIAYRDKLIAEGRYKKKC